MSNRDEAVYIARAVYRRLPAANKADFSATLLIEIIMRQGVRDPLTRHKLDPFRACAVRADGQKTTAGMVYKNCMIVNGEPEEVCVTEK